MTLRRDRSWPLLAALALLLLAAFLRLYQLDILPPGMYSDVATNGLDVRDVLAGHLRIFFPANNGREALFIYLQALLVAGAGIHPYVFSFAAVVMGMLSVALGVRFFSELFGAWPGLAAAALLATSFWSLVLSRLGLRAVSVPAFVLASLYLLWRLLRTGRARYAWLGGIVLGAALYTYISARLLPPLAVLLCLADPRLAVKRWRSLLGLGLVAALVFLPEGLYFLQHQNAFLHRAQEVSVFNPDPEIRGSFDRPWQSVLETARMFFLHGDEQSLQNVPGRPALDPVLAPLFVLGLAGSLWLARRDGRYRWLLLWLVVFSLPSALSHESPDFLRSYGVAPAVFGLTALGLTWIVRALLRLPSRLGRAPAAGAAALGLIVVGWSTAATIRLYFGPWARDPRTYDAYMAGSVRLADFVDHRPEQRLFFAYHVRWPVELLAPRTERGQWYADDVNALALPARPEADALYVASTSSVWSRLEPQRLPGLQVVWRPAEVKSSTDFLAFTWPARDQAAFLARQKPAVADMSPDLQLVSYSVDARPGGSVVNLVWRPLRLAGPYDLFLHLLDGAGKQVAQSDLIARAVDDGDSSDYLLLTQHELDAPPGQYTAEVGAVHRSADQPERLAGGTIGQVAHLPVVIGG